MVQERGRNAGDDPGREWLASIPSFEPALRKRARLLLPPGLDPDDAVGECSRRAVRSAQRFDTRRELGHWLGSILRHECQARWKRHALRRAKEPLLPRPVSEVVELGSADEVSAAVHTALGALSAPDRMVIRLHYLHEMSIEEIARIVAKRQRTVRKNLERALAPLRSGPCGPELAALWRPAKRRVPAWRRASTSAPGAAAPPT